MEKIAKFEKLATKYLPANSKKGFSLLAGINRPISPAQVSKLSVSLRKFKTCVRNVLVAKVPFLDTQQLYIIDGQHLYNALLKEGWDIPYSIIEVKSKQDLVEKIALLNASSKTWSMIDYVTAWSFISEDYFKLLSYYNQYDLDLRITASLLMNTSLENSDTARRLKTGTFRIVKEKEGVEILRKVNDLLHIIPRVNRLANRYAVSEYVNYIKSEKRYNHEKFMKNLEKNKNLFVIATQEDGKLVELFRKLNT